MRKEKAEEMETERQREREREREREKRIINKEEDGARFNESVRSRFITSVVSSGCRYGVVSV